MNYPKIAIIIVHYNGRRYLNGLFFSLAQVEYKGEWEIVVVDNVSTDNSLDYIKERFAPKFDNLKLIESKENLGFAGGNNIGMKYAMDNGFDYVYLLNQDTVVLPDFLSCIAPYAKDGVGSVQSMLYIHDPAIIGFPRANSVLNSVGNGLHYLGFGYAYGYGWKKEKADKYIEEWKRRDPELRVAYGSGAGLLLSVPALRKVGLFQKDYFMYHEDLDLGWRLSLAGYKNILAPDSIIYHKYEFSKSIQKYYWMERNRFLTIFQNYAIWSLFLIFPALVAMELGSFVFAIKSGFWREKLRAYAFIFNPKTWARISRERRKIQAMRKVEDYEITKFFTSRVLFQDIDNWVLSKIANPIFTFYWKVIKLFV